jgi:hypothetical protein
MHTPCHRSAHLLLTSVQRMHSITLSTLVTYSHPLVLPGVTETGSVPGSPGGARKIRLSPPARYLDEGSHAYKRCSARKNTLPLWRIRCRQYANQGDAATRFKDSLRLSHVLLTRHIRVPLSDSRDSSGFESMQNTNKCPFHVLNRPYLVRKAANDNRGTSLLGDLFGQLQG